MIVGIAQRKKKIRLAAFLAPVFFGWLVLSPAAPRPPAAHLPWLHRGLVLNFTWYAAITAGNGSYYEEDDHGNWINRATGKTYDRTMQTGTSGSGWTELTIVDIDGDKVVLKSDSFANAGALGHNAPVPQGTSSFVGNIADPGDYWMDPAKLAGLTDSPTATVRAGHVSWKSGDATVDAIRLQVLHGFNYSDHVYDAKTGICLHTASSSRGAPPKLVGPGDMGQGDTTLTRNEFLGLRDISVPWAASAVPDWVATVRSLHYRGSVISHGPLPTVPNVLTMDLVTSSRGPTWLEVSGTSSQQTQGAPQIPPASLKAACGRNQFDGLWIPPQALAQLQQGQTLDQDPLSKMRTAVSKVDASSVEITSSNPAGEIDNQYDRRTGMLIYSSFYNVLSQQQRALKLQSHD